MISSPATTLKTIRRSLQEVLLPDLTSSHAKTQALAMLQAIDMLLQADTHLDDALFRQNGDLRALLADLTQAIGEDEASGRTADEALSRLKQEILARRDAVVAGAPATTGKLMADNDDLTALFSRIMAMLADKAHRADPVLHLIRTRARTILADRYGMDMTYNPVWVE